MSSLSGKQVGEIKNLYESIYTEETVDETVEVSYDEYSDEELLGLFVEEVATEVLATLYENDCLSENYVLSEKGGGIDLLSPLKSLTGFGLRRRVPTRPEIQKGLRGPQRNTYPDRVDQRGRTIPGREMGQNRRFITSLVLGGLTNELSKTDLGRSIIKRFGGALTGAGQGFMKDPKTDPKPESGVYQQPDGTIRVR